MKFYCEACNTKYSIPDEKIQGKVLKVRCKSCGNIITVREQLSPVSATDSEPTTAQPNPLSPPPPPSPEPKVPATNWYYSINGQSSGPFDLKTLRARFESGTIGDESYVWHESIVEWKPVSTVPAFQEALSKGQRLKPRAKTLGFTGPLEAIKVEKVDKAPAGKQAGMVPEAAEKATEPAPRLDRLDKLREKLRNDAPVEPESAPKARLDQPKLEQPRVEKPKFEQPKLEQPKVEKPKVDPLKLGQPKLEQPKFGQPKFEQPKFEQPKAEPLPEPVDTAEISFGPTVPAAKATPKTDFELKPFSADLFAPNEDAPDDLEEWATAPPESPADSGLIPFFPESPKLSSTMSAAPTTSGSLLIQLDSIRKEGRGKRVAFIGGSIAVLLIAVVVGAYIASTYEPSKDTVVLAKKESRPAPVEKTYSREQLSSLGIELGEEIIEAGEKAQEEEPVAKVEPATKTVSRVEETVSRVEGKGTNSKVTKVEDRPVVTKVEAAPKEVATKPAEEAGGAVSAQSVLNYTNPTTVARNSGPTINRPEDSLTAQAAMPSTLSKESARDGFRVIRNSVMLCRERHMRRGATLDAKKIHISVTVEPNGTVSQYGVEPATVANTEFDLCMKSHMERWRFAKWQGIATEINSSFVLQ